MTHKVGDLVRHKRTGDIFEITEKSKGIILIKPVKCSIRNYVYESNFAVHDFNAWFDKVDTNEFGSDATKTILSL